MQLQFQQFLESAPPEFAHTPADLQAICMLCSPIKPTTADWTGFLDKHPLTEVRSTIGSFSKSVKRKISDVRKKLNEGVVIDKNVKVAYPVHVAEALIHALYSNQIAVMREGHGMTTPEDLPTYIQIFELADQVGFTCVRKIIAADLKARAPYLIRNTYDALELGALLAKQHPEEDHGRLKVMLKEIADAADADKQ